MKHTSLLFIFALVGGALLAGCDSCPCGMKSGTEGTQEKTPEAVVVEETVIEEIAAPETPATPEAKEEAKELDELAQPQETAQPDIIEDAAEINLEEAAPAESSAMTSSDDRQAMPGTNDQWRPETANSTDWIAKEQASHFLLPPADNSALLEGGQKAGHTYKNVTKQDLVVWEKETERLVTEGSRIFHNADELGSTIAVSCDMCHPDGSNTHPETYPKYQVQLGRAALLRDMINWCLENPCRGKPLSGDDPKMRALEAYIMAMRAGKALEYGKH